MLLCKLSDGFFIRNGKPWQAVGCVGRSEFLVPGVPSYLKNEAVI